MSHWNPFLVEQCEVSNTTLLTGSSVHASEIKANSNDAAGVAEPYSQLAFDRITGELCLDPTKAFIENSFVNLPTGEFPQGSTGLSSDLFLDGQSLQEIKLLEDEQIALRQIAEQFEAIFLQQMLKNMRAASTALADEDNPLTAQSDSMYQDMMDSQLALNMSQSNGIGIAEMLVQQLSKS